MKKVNWFLMSLVLFLSVGLASCVDESQNKKSSEIQIDKHGSVVIDMKIKHLEGVDLLETTKLVYDTNGKLVKNVTTCDSLPSMGMVKDTLLVTKDGEDDRDTIVSHPKNYQLFITVSK